MDNALAIDVAKDALIRSLSLTETQPGTIFSGEQVLVLTPNGLFFGTAEEDRGTMRTYRYENITVAGELVLTRKYAIAESPLMWEDRPTVETAHRNAHYFTN